MPLNYCYRKTLYDSHQLGEFLTPASIIAFSFLGFFKHGKKKKIPYIIISTTISKCNIFGHCTLSANPNRQLKMTRTQNQMFWQRPSQCSDLNSIEIWSIFCLNYILKFTFYMQEDPLHASPTLVDIIEKDSVMLFSLCNKAY